MRAALAVLTGGVFAVAALAAAQGPAPRAVEGRPQGGKAQDGKRQEDRSQPVTVDADRMERFGKESLIIFTGNVVARQNNSAQYADRMEVYIDEKGDKILRTVSTGNVRIVTRDCKTGTAKRAEYFDLEQRVVLVGNARVWQDDNVVSGDTITIYLAQDRNVVLGGKQERVKAVFYAKDDNKSATAKAASASGGGSGPATACVN